MSEEASNQNMKKGGEAELSEIIAWLSNELTCTEQQKRDKILQAAKKLRELGFRKDWIASTIAEHSDMLGVSRSYIYDSLPAEFKSKRRSDAQKEAKRTLSPVSDSEMEAGPIVVGSDGHSFGDGLDDESNGSATKAWREAAATRNETLDPWIPVVTSMIDKSVIDGEYVRVPLDIWEQFKKVADEALS